MDMYKYTPDNCTCFPSCSLADEHEEGKSLPFFGCYYKYYRRRSRAISATACGMKAKIMLAATGLSVSLAKCGGCIAAMRAAAAACRNAE
jgi:hypothetical protein